MFAGGRRFAWLLYALALGPAFGVAGDPPSPAQHEQTPAKPSEAQGDEEVDEDLLEFLGSVDADESDLIEYAARTKTPVSSKAKGESAAPGADKPASGVTQKAAGKNG